jgi:hypothetical protein
MLDAVQGRNTSVRGTISKGRFAQGTQHPRIFGWGHIDRGHINPALKLAGPCNLWGNVFNLGQIIYTYNVTFYNTVKIGAESYYNVAMNFFQ